MFNISKQNILFHYTCAKPNHRIPSYDLDRPHSLHKTVLVHRVSNSDATKQDKDFYCHQSHGHNALQTS